MFAGLKAAASQAYEKTKERVETAAAGKKLLEQGPEIQAKLLAKKASVDAVAIDKTAVAQLTHLVAEYAVVAEKMTGASQLPVPEAAEFAKFGNEYKTRGDALRTRLDRLATVPPAASVAADEEDAIAMLMAKLKAESLRTSVTTGASDLKGMAARNSFSVKEKAQAAVDATRTRVDTAKAGKQLLDEDKPEIKAALLVKKASLDVVSLDNKVVAVLIGAVEGYEGAAKKLKVSVEQGSNECPSFGNLAAQYDARASLLREQLSSLPPSPAAAAVSAQEMDAITILGVKTVANDAKEKLSAAVSSVREGAASSIQTAQERAAEVAVRQTVAKATGGYAGEASGGAGSGAAAAGYVGGQAPRASGSGAAS